MGKLSARTLLFDKNGDTLGELAKDETFALVRTEEINGEHTLNLVTSRPLTTGVRVVRCDETGKWREWVIYKPDEAHQEGKHAIGTYGAMWSMQYDLMSSYTTEHAEPGMGSSCAAAAAVAAALDGQTRWTVGTVDVGPVAKGKGCVMIGISAWERLKLVVQHWGGEVDAHVTVNATTGVVARAVDFRAHLGSTEAIRRFDWAKDLTSIHRIPDEGPYYCRVVPLGRGTKEYAEDDKTEFDWPVGIEEETGGRAYIEDAEAAQAFRTKNPDGTYNYPTKVVHYDESDPELLLGLANDDLENHTKPKVSYEADVLQFAEAGMDAQGVELGDDTQCVDRGFNEDAPLTITGRVQRIEVDELAPKVNTRLTIGSLGPSFASTMKQLIGTSTRDLANSVNHITQGGTIAYLEHLVDDLNQAINATGGYSYLVPGEGLLTYDVAVTDPANPVEAHQVVQIKGGSIRIADTRTAGGDWDWKTVFVSGKIAANLIVAAELTTGFIGNPNGINFWNLDTDEISISGDAFEIGSKQYLNGTADWSNWRSAGNWSFSSDTTTCAAKSSVTNWRDVICSPFAALKYTALRGYYATLSFEAISDDAWGADSETNRVYVRFALTQNDTVTSTLLHIDQTFMLDKVWTRYKCTIQLKDSAFVQDAAIVPDLSTLWLEVRIYNRSKHRIRVRRVKLERGKTSTDWVESAADIRAYASSAAKTESQLINDSFTAEKTFNRLTNNGRIKCIKRTADGNLWINASFIEADTLKAEMIRAGILADKKGKVAINLNTGKATLKALTATNATINGRIYSGTASGSRMEIRNGGLIGYFGKKKISVIDTAVSVVNELFSKSKYLNGMRIQTGGTLEVDAPSIYLTSTGSGGRFGGVPISNMSGMAFTGTVKLKQLAHAMNQKMTSCKNGDLELMFVNGMLVNVFAPSTLATAYRQKPKYDSACVNKSPITGTSAKTSSGTGNVVSL